MNKNYKLECTKARAKILSAFPHLSPLVLGLPYTILPNFDSALVTAGGMIGIGEGFIDKYTNAELAGVLLHEGFHVMLDHSRRAGGRDHKKWNLAADLVINETLRRMTAATPDVKPDADMMYPEKFGFTWAGSGAIPTAEAVYTALPEQAGKSKSCGSGSGGAKLPQEEGLDPGGSIPEDLRVRLDLAAGGIADALKKAGLGSAELELWASSVVRRPKFDLFKEIRTLVNSAIASARGRIVEPTWGKLNRRGFEYLPGRKHFVPEVTVIVDTSGSMFNSHAGDHVLTEMAGILLRLGKVRVITNDTRVNFDGFVRSVAEFKQHAKGGGGTDLTPAFRRAADSKAPIVVLTDGELGLPDAPGAADAIWLLTSRNKQPWMRRSLVLDRAAV